MSGGAIVMMLVAMLVLWGGLTLAIMNLRRGQTPGLEDVHRDL
jgi:Putative methionine and alanine importer, small subunit